MKLYKSSILILSVILFSACSGDSEVDVQKLYGSWLGVCTEDEVGSYISRLTFNEDGTGTQGADEFDSDNCSDDVAYSYDDELTFTIDGTKINVVEIEDDNDEVVVIVLKLSDSQLVIKLESGRERTYSKV